MYNPGRSRGPSGPWPGCACIPAMGTELNSVPGRHVAAVVSDVVLPGNEITLAKRPGELLAAGKEGSCLLRAREKVSPMRGHGS